MGDPLPDGANLADRRWHFTRHTTCIALEAIVDDVLRILEDGEIKDIGDHEALMAKPDGAYKHFVELQGT